MEIGWRSADNIKREKQMYTGNLQGLKKYSNSKWHRFCKHNHSVVTQIPPTGGFFFPPCLQSITDFVFRAGLQ